MSASNDVLIDSKLRMAIISLLINFLRKHNTKAFFSLFAKHSTYSILEVGTNTTITSNDLKYRKNF